MAEADPATPSQPFPGRWALLAVGLVLALAASGAGVLRGFQRSERDTGAAVQGAFVGALLGAAVAAMLLAVLAWHRRRHGVAIKALSGGAVAALLAMLIGVAATLGASTAPPAAPAASTPAGGKVSPEPTAAPFGAVIDAASGRGYADRNGDGLPDYELVRCPPRTGASPTDETDAPRPTYRVGDVVQIAIDDDCDGTIDSWIEAKVLPEVQLGAPPANPPAEPQEPEGGGDSGGFGPVLLAILLLIAAAAVAAAIIALVRGWTPLGPRQAPEPPPMPLLPEPAIDEAAAADSLAESARRLLHDPDPRRAIIAAYAELLDGLAAAGAARAAHEAPEEHLQRSLRQLGIPPAPLSEVTRLFLVARFSNHPLGETDRQQALRALNDAERILRHSIAERQAVQAAVEAAAAPAPPPAGVRR